MDVILQTLEPALYPDLHQYILVLQQHFCVSIYRM